MKANINRSAIKKFGFQITQQNINILYLYNCTWKVKAALQGSLVTCGAAAEMNFNEPCLAARLLLGNTAHQGGNILQENKSCPRICQFLKFTFLSNFIFLPLSPSNLHCPFSVCPLLFIVCKKGGSTILTAFTTRRGILTKTTFFLY